MCSLFPPMPSTPEKRSPTVKSLMYSIRYGKIIVKMIDPFWLLLVGIVIVVGGILVLRLQAFLALMLGALAVGLLTSSDMLLYYAQQSGMNEAAATVLARQTVGERVAVAFGNTCAKIGILIAMASIIGGSRKNSTFGLASFWCKECTPRIFIQQLYSCHSCIF
jgi:hypothetical protein